MFRSLGELLLGGTLVAALMTPGALTHAQRAGATRADDVPTLRLPAAVKPLSQQIDLTIDPKQEMFSGTTLLDLTIGHPVPIVWLNARDLHVTRAVLEAGTVNERLSVVKGSDDVLGFRRATGQVGAGRWRLRIDFDGVISRRDTEGIFAQESGGDWYAFTQFEPLGARRAFPCFDEPGFKIPWQITLRVPEGVQAFSNGPERSRRRAGDHTIVSFVETPALPTYLVAAAVGPFDIVDGGRAGRKGTPLRVLVPRGRASEAAHAVRMTPRILEWVEEYFDAPYPFDKLDQVVVPSFGGAMENAGLITYSELLLLQKPEHETLEWREWALKIAAHEIAHNWFGNLVTMAWWDDLWLNEGFASWMQQRVAEELAPELNLSPGAVFERSIALDSDALTSARKVRQPIVSNHDIASAFDGITYMKGQAVLQMIEGWLGRDVFRQGVRRYMAAHARGNATSADFVKALSTAAGRDLSPVFGGFLDQTGAPVVEVSLECGSSAPRVMLKQRPYRPLGAGAGAADAAWQVPVCLESRTGADVERTCTLLSTPADTVAARSVDCPQVVLGNQAYTGYYRTLHSPELFERLIAAKDTLTPVARQGLLLDLRALVQSGDEKAGRALAAVAGFANDEDRYVGLAAISVVGWLRDFVPTTHEAQYATFVRTLFADRAKRLGWRSAASESADVRSIRADVLRAAGVFGADPTLRREAVALARAWLQDAAAVEADMVAPVLAVASSSGDRALFEAYRDFLLATPDRARRAQLIGALPSARSAEAATVLLPVALDPRLEPMDAMHLVMVLSRATATRDATLDFVRQRYDTFVARLPKGSTFDGSAALIGLGGPLCDERRREQFNQFYASRIDAIPGGPRQLAQVVEGIDACIAQRRAIEPEIAAFLSARPQASAQ